MFSKITTIILFSLFQICSPHDTLDETKNITIGQTIVSSGSIFELGFFKPGQSTNWFVGIWFVVSPDTIVWVANPDNPMNDSSSTLTISKGVIILVDPKENIVWSSNVSSSIAKNISNSFMQLLDSGNLVTKDSTTGDIIWQSFNYPSNTLLPGMKLGKNLIENFEWFLSSWKSALDPSQGDYRYKMDTLGVPQNILWIGAQIKFRTGPWDGLRFSGVPEMKTYENMFSFKLVSDVNEVYYSFEAKEGAPLSRLVLNETGVVQRMVWDQTSRAWSEFWYGPKDPCDYYGKCGPFGICNINEVTICGCIHGFTPKSSEEWSMRNFSSGCQRKTQLSCNNNDNGFNLIKGVKVPDTHSATVDAGISIKECRNRCLMNCSCLAYSILDVRGGGSGCITWSNDLIDIRYIPGAQDIYVKTAKTDLVPEDVAGTGNKVKRGALIGIIASSTITVLLLITGIIVWKKLRTNSIVLGQSTSQKDIDIPIIIEDIGPQVFDLATIKASTGNFSDENKIAEGTFGVVYKGQLENGEVIAVKKLKNLSQGLNEFVNEVRTIAKLRHRNLISLLGYCIQDEEKMLICKYMTNKSLVSVIFHKDRCKLFNWEKRLEIIIGIARGLRYLHQDCVPNIIHRDLKAENILLDENMIPKISDFGTARFFNGRENELATEIVVGTRGYMAPEYVLLGQFSVKSDVYSFGVLLLEIISGKRNNRNQNLLAYARKLWQEGNAMHLADVTIPDSSSVRPELLRCIYVGLLCVQECPDDRPTMERVESWLTSESIIDSELKITEVCTRITAPLALLREQLFHSTNELTVTDIEGR